MLNTRCLGLPFSSGRLADAIVHAVEVAAVHVVDSLPAEERVPDVGVEFDPLLLAPAGDLDLAQPFVPFSAGFVLDRLEIPRADLHVQIFPGLRGVAERNADLHQQHVTAINLKLRIDHQRMAGRRTDRPQVCFLPGPKRGKGLLKRATK